MANGPIIQKNVSKYDICFMYYAKVCSKALLSMFRENCRAAEFCLKKKLLSKIQFIRRIAIHPDIRVQRNFVQWMANLSFR